MKGLSFFVPFFGDNWYFQRSERVVTSTYSEIVGCEPPVYVKSSSGSELVNP
jgi:hypothetical protein